MNRRYNFLDTVVLLFRVVVLGIYMVVYSYIQVISYLIFGGEKGKKEITL